MRSERLIRAGAGADCVWRKVQRPSPSWQSGARISASGNGGRSERTTVPTATPGNTFLTIMPGAALTGGAKTASRVSRTISNGFACRSPCGTNAIPSSKERLFGLTNSEGNHGEDVKELYYYLDATPSHSYLKMLYKYPQTAFPYTRSRRGKSPPRNARPRI